MEENINILDFGSGALRVEYARVIQDAVVACLESTSQPDMDDIREEEDEAVDQNLPEIQRSTVPAYNSARSCTAHHCKDGGPLDYASY